MDIIDHYGDKRLAVEIKKFLDNFWLVRQATLYRTERLDRFNIIIDLNIDDDYIFIRDCSRYRWKETIQEKLN